MSSDVVYTIEYAFRIIGIPETELTLVLDGLGDLPHTTGTYYLDPSKRVVAIPLVKGTDYSRLYSLMRRHPFSDISHGIFISLTTDASDTGIEFPEHVLAVYSTLGGNIDISLIFVRSDAG